MGADEDAETHPRYESTLSSAGPHEHLYPDSARSCPGSLRRTLTYVVREEYEYREDALSELDRRYPRFLEIHGQQPSPMPFYEREDGLLLPDDPGMIVQYLVHDRAIIQASVLGAESGTIETGTVIQVNNWTELRPEWAGGSLRDCARNHYSCGGRPISVQAIVQSARSISKEFPVKLRYLPGADTNPIQAVSDWLLPY